MTINTLKEVQLEVSEYEQGSRARGCGQALIDKNQTGVLREKQVKF